MFAVARRQQIVRTDVDLNRAQPGEFRDELLAILHVGVVRLVIAEVRPDRLQRSDPGFALDEDRYRLLRPGLRQSQKTNERHAKKCSQHGFYVTNKRRPK